MVDIKIARHTSSSRDIEEDFGQVQESDPLMFYDQFQIWWCLLKIFL